VQNSVNAFINMNRMVICHLKIVDCMLIHTRCFQQCVALLSPVILFYGAVILSDILFVTSCQLVYHSDLVLSSEQPMCGAVEAGSDKW
jgi:hypothetical protein